MLTALLALLAGSFVPRDLRATCSLAWIGTAGVLNRLTIRRAAAIGRTCGAASHAQECRISGSITILDSGATCSGPRELPPQGLG
ncbi:hypothetical protein B0H14DRAFT_1609679 [Mycena olivaceomarginata]|nr:hypothetical protein B0H14DRAFT_1609679 [Mycena olivaceomarginata]